MFIKKKGFVYLTALVCNWGANGHSSLHEILRPPGRLTAKGTPSLTVPYHWKKCSPDSDSNPVLLGKLNCGTTTQERRNPWCVVCWTIAMLAGCLRSYAACRTASAHRLPIRCNAGAPVSNYYLHATTNALSFDQNVSLIFTANNFKTAHNHHNCGNKLSWRKYWCIVLGHIARNCICQQKPRIQYFCV
jgi:hypothetical protein